MWRRPYPYPPIIQRASSCSSPQGHAQFPHAEDNPEAWDITNSRYEAFFFIGARDLYEGLQVGRPAWCCVLPVGLQGGLGKAPMQLAARPCLEPASLSLIHWTSVDTQAVGKLVTSPL